MKPFPDDNDLTDNEQLELYNPLSIDLDFYHGPLDLLLDLIQKKKMDIFSVRLAEICEPYLAIVMTDTGRDLEKAGEFMVIAATLILIKSGQLLPPDVSEVGGDDDTVNPEEELRRKLIEYKRYKEISEQLNRRKLLNREIFIRPDDENDMAPAEYTVNYHNLNIYELVKSFLTVNKRVNQIKPYRIVKEELSLERQIRVLVELLLPYVNAENPAEFNELIRSKTTGVAMLVLNFCALLEIVKNFHIEISQAQHYGGIYIFPNQLMAESIENID